jgi:protein-S-isoprenylcysteine O-methyltransferase Ste14
MIIFYSVYSVWFMSELLLNRLRRSAISDKRHVDKNTLLILWIVIIVAMFLGMVVKLNSSFPIAHEGLINYSGLAIIIAGMIIRLMAVRQLGRYFTVDVTIRSGHQIMTGGLYKYVRHPSYSGSLLSFVGYGISLNNYVSLAIVFIPVFLSFLYRMHVEEKALIDQFGQAYNDYKTSTKRLIPLLY